MDLNDDRQNDTAPPPYSEFPINIDTGFEDSPTALLQVVIYCDKDHEQILNFLMKPVPQNIELGDPLMIRPALADFVEKYLYDEKSRRIFESQMDGLMKCRANEVPPEDWQKCYARFGRLSGPPRNGFIRIAVGTWNDLLGGIQGPEMLPLIFIGALTHMIDRPELADEDQSKLPESCRWVYELNTRKQFIQAGPISETRAEKFKQKKGSWHLPFAEIRSGRRKTDFYWAEVVEGDTAAERSPRSVKKLLKPSWWHRE